MAFLSKDGYIDSAEFTSLAREIDKFAAKEGLKPAEIHFAGKVIPKYDTAKAKANPDLFTRKRAQVIKVRTRMPAAGSRMKMVVVLRNYKGLEEFEDFTKDFNAALKAIAAHNKLAEKTIAAYKKEGLKKRQQGAKEFDKNADAFIALLEGAGVKAANIAVGTSMMGKTIIVKLPNGGFVSVGKADAERFKKAKDSENGKEPAKKPFGRAKKVVEDDDEDEAPVRKTRAVKKAPAAPSRKPRTAAR